MNSITLVPGIGPDLVNDLGWTLIHFLWQGIALTLPLQLALRAFPGARARYNLAFFTLICMALAPVATFLLIHRHGAETAPLPSLSGFFEATESPAGHGSPALEMSWMNWVVSAWLCGIFALSIRTAGGWYVVHRLTRCDVLPLPRRLLARCEHLVARAGIKRSVRFLQSTRVNVPALVGWLRPVILLPVAAVAGFPPAQLEAVIMHELGHIRRLDALANLMQIVIETVLFYHPAVWWVSRQVRLERENCCDDIAVGLSGDAVGYARALTALEEWRRLPLPAVGANGGALKQRIARLLGLDVRRGNTSAVMVAAVALLCLASCVVARGTSESAMDQVPSKQARADTTSANPSPAPAAPLVTPQTNTLPAADAPGVLAAQDHAEIRSNRLDPSYIDAMKAVGIDDRTRLLAMKATGIRASYVKSLHDAGLKPTPDQIIALHTQGVTPAFVRAARGSWGDVSVNDLLAMRAMRYDPADARAFKQLGLSDLSVHELAAYKAVGVTPDYIRALQDAGLDPHGLSAEDLTAFKATGVSPELIGALNALGLKDFTTRDYVTAQVRGLRPDFLAAVRNHHFKNLTMRHLLAFKEADVF